MNANTDKLGAVIAERRADLGYGLAVTVRLHASGKTSHAFDTPGVDNLHHRQVAELRRAYSELRQEHSARFPT